MSDVRSFVVRVYRQESRAWAGVMLCGMSTGSHRDGTVQELRVFAPELPRQSGRRRGRRALRKAATRHRHPGPATHHEERGGR